MVADLHRSNHLKKKTEIAIIYEAHLHLIICQVIRIEKVQLQHILRVVVVSPRPIPWESNVRQIE